MMHDGAALDASRAKHTTQRACCDGQPTWQLQELLIIGLLMSMQWELAAE